MAEFIERLVFVVCCCGFLAVVRKEMSMVAKQKAELKRNIEQELAQRGEEEEARRIREKVRKWLEKRRKLPWWKRILSDLSLRRDD